MKFPGSVSLIGLLGALSVLMIGSALANPPVAYPAGFNGHGVSHRNHGNPPRHWHHGHHSPRLTFSVGPLHRPWIYPPYYYDPFFYRQRWSERPIIIEQPAPQIYVEQPQQYVQPAPVQSADTNNYWYFCEAAQAYFPYVNECAGGWQRVVPQPPPPPQFRQGK